MRSANNFRPHPGCTRPTHWFFGAVLPLVLGGCITVRDRVVEDRPAPAPSPAPAVAVQVEVPPPVVEPVTYEVTLSPYGSWVVSSHFGRVWVPNYTVVGSGWRPYTYGSWEYTEYGWTWVDDYPWAYTVHHYGRWGWDPYHGWVWVPGSVWGPAWVVWRTGGAYVGWAPAPPGYVVGMDVTIGGGSWIFIHTTYMGSTGVYRHVIYGHHHHQCLAATHIHHDVRHHGSHRWNHGPSTTYVSRATGRHIHVTRVSDLDRDDRPVFRPGRNDGHHGGGSHGGGSSHGPSTDTANTGGGHGPSRGGGTGAGSGSHGPSQGGTAGNDHHGPGGDGNNTHGPSTGGAGTAGNAHGPSTGGAGTEGSAHGPGSGGHGGGENRVVDFRRDLPAENGGPGTVTVVPSNGQDGTGPQRLPPSVGTGGSSRTGGLGASQPDEDNTTGRDRAPMPGLGNRTGGLVDSGSGNSDPEDSGNGSGGPQRLGGRPGWVTPEVHDRRPEDPRTSTDGLTSRPNQSNQPVHGTPSWGAPAPSNSSPGWSTPQPTQPSRVNPGQGHIAPSQPAPSYNRPAPAQPAPSYNRPAPAQPAPSYNRPAPSQPSPSFNRPAPAQPAPSYNRPAPSKPAPSYNRPAPSKPAPSFNRPAPAQPRPVSPAPSAKPAPAPRPAAPAPSQPPPKKKSEPEKKAIKK